MKHCLQCSVTSFLGPLPSRSGGGGLMTLPNEVHLHEAPQRGVIEASV